LNLRRFATMGVVVFAAALVVRVLYAISIRDASFLAHLQTEPEHYDAWARAIISGAAPVHLPFDEAPGYPYFVAIIYAIAGHSVLAVVLVQAVLGAAACAAIGVVARRLGGSRAGWIAGGLAAAYGPFIYFTGQLEPAALAVAAVAGALAATPVGEASQRRWLLAGAAWAGAIVVRSELVIAIPFVAAHAWLAAGRRAALRAAAAPAALVVLALAANTIASGHPVLLTTGAGVNLWLGNNPDADGVNPFVHGRLEQVVAAVEATTADPVERDSAFRAHAELDASLLAKKLVWTFSRRELPNAADIPWQTAQSWVFHPPVFPLGFGIVLPLALVGAVVARERRRQLLYLLGPIAAAVVVCVVFFTNARFRLPMMPSLLILAGLAIEPAVRALRAPRTAVPVVAALAVGIALAFPSTFGLAQFRVAQIDFNTGALEHQAGHLDRAALYLRAGLSREPHDSPSWIELAIVLEQAGDLEGARAAWNDAIANNPDDPNLRRLATQHVGAALVR
jgi:4-amino-4-deoxy-L-arabinose transferase-like glycosyltransferase